MTGNQDRQQGQKQACAPCYFVTSFDGDVLTGVDQDCNLEWTNTALLQESNKRAVTFGNPYQIPAKIARQLSSDHQVFRIQNPVSEKEGFLNELLGAEYIGAYKKYRVAFSASMVISGRRYQP